MREIKFRAWNTSTKEMFNVDVLAISACTWDCPDHGKRGVSIAYQPHIKIMQYTGLKDKNGKGIYEGDIVQYWGGEYWYGCWKYSGEIIIKDLIGDCFMLGEHEYLGIIGNIYENPELLKEDE